MIILYILLALYLFQFVYSLAAISSLELHDQISEDIEISKIPAHVVELLQKQISELEQIGFNLIGATWIKQTRLNYQPSTYELLFHKKDSNTMAQLLFGSMLLREDMGSVIFTNLFADNHRAITFNCLLSNWTIRNENSSTFDPVVNSITKQLEHHQLQVTMLTKAHGQPHALSENEIRNLEHKFWFSDWDDMIKDQLILVEKNGKMRFSFKWSFQVAYNIFMKGAKSQRQRRLSWAWTESGDKQNISLETEILINQEENKTQKPRLSTAAKLSILAVSALMFIASFAISEDARTIPILFVVVLIHELGHLAAMWAFGGRDLNMMFIPFLGAVAISENQRMSASQQVIMLLSGPIPGIIIGLLLSLSSITLTSPFLEQTADWFIWINLFNLLPLTPLDGGRIVQTLISARFIRIGIAFQLFGFAVLALLGTFLNIILTIIAVLGFYSTLKQNRILLASGRIKRELLREDLNEHELINRLVSKLRETKLSNLPLIKRMQSAKQILIELKIAQPKLATSFLFSLIYVFLFFTSSYFAFKLPTLKSQVLYNTFRQYSSENNNEQAAELGELLIKSGFSEPSMKFATYHDLAEIYINLGKPEQAIKILKKAKEDSEENVKLYEDLLEFDKNDGKLLQYLKEAKSNSTIYNKHLSELTGESLKIESST